MPAGIKNMSVNSALSLSIIRRRKKEIETCGIDFKLLEAFAAHTNPLHLAVSDKNLGMEKLDYLERDGLLTILSRPTGLDYLRRHIYFVDHQLAIDEKAIDNALETQNFYLKMYKNVYLRKTSAIAQRMFQKMTHHLILEGIIAARDLPGLTDSELFGVMRFSQDETVQKLYELFKNRDLFREAVVLRPKSFADSENETEKYIATFGIGEKELQHLIAAPGLQIKNQTVLEELENKIAEIAGLPKDSVLVVPITDPERFDAQDIMVYRGKGKKPASLKERYPAHFKNIEEVTQTYVAFRICTTEKNRRALSSPKIASKIHHLVMNY
jgi:HD superfamily phosphohydrolase